MNTVLVIGELLWDYVDGHRTAAGAPYNFARHLLNCGQRPYLVSAVCDDPDGRALNDEVVINDIDSFILTSKRFPTGYARVFSENGKNRFELGTPAAWDDIVVTKEDIDSLFEYSYIYFGTLAQRSEDSRISIRNLVEASHVKCIFDINLRPPFEDMDVMTDTILWSLEHCNILKISHEDMEILQTFHLFSGIDDIFEFLLNHTKIEVILETLGEKGARYYDSSGKTIFCPAPKVSAVSTVGAGDAFLASFISSLIDKKHPLESLNHAVEYAAQIVAAQ